MDYQAFRKEHPATRCFQPYTSEQRANHAASFRLGYRQRQAVGHSYYTHPMVPGIAFDTAKAATTRAYEVWLAERQQLAMGETEAKGWGYGAARVAAVSLSIARRAASMPRAPPRYDLAALSSVASPS